MPEGCVKSTLCWSMQSVCFLSHEMKMKKIDIIKNLFTQAAFQLNSDDFVEWFRKQFLVLSFSVSFLLSLVKQNKGVKSSVRIGPGFTEKGIRFLFEERRLHSIDIFGIVCLCNNDAIPLQDDKKWKSTKKKVRKGTQTLNEYMEIIWRFLLCGFENIWVFLFRFLFLVDSSSLSYRHISSNRLLLAFNCSHRKEFQKSISRLGGKQKGKENK